MFEKTWGNLFYLALICQAMTNFFLYQLIFSINQSHQMIYNFSKEFQQCSESFEPILPQPKLIRSQKSQEYERMIPQLYMDSFSIQSFFRQNGIFYDPLSKYERFSFTLQRSVPMHRLYKIHVKIAHFDLKITALRHEESNLFRDEQNIKSSSAKIYFTELNSKKLCFKSFPFNSEESFQIQFRKVIKEWSILKICSVLECGPFMENYLGFDLIIYDDCIQYVTEKGTQHLDFGPIESKQLVEQLALMHRLQIIHYDIKPANVIFSPVYQKPVFIDFGLSQIIEEKIGFKTIGGFRGTPNYCCPQMFVLMLAEDSYVDLYYNDAFCLKLTAVSLSKSQENNYQELSLIQLSARQEQNLLFFAFRYYYLSDEQSKAIIAFQRYRNKGGSITKVLQLIKSTINYMFLSTFFQSAISQYHGHFLYQEIQKQLKISHEKIFFRKSIAIQKQTNVQCFLPLPYSINEKMMDDVQSNQNYQHLISVILDVKQFQEKSIWNYVSIIFTCIRFDRPNFSTKDKLKIAKKIIPLLIAYQEKNSQILYPNELDCQLNEIRHILSIILELILESKSNNWSINHIFDVCQQLCLLDVDMNGFADTFLAFVQQHYTNHTEIILAVLQCNRLKNTLLLISSNKLDKMETFYAKLDNFIEIYLNKFKDQTLNTTNRQIIQIRNIISSLYVNQDCINFISIEDEEVILRFIRHSKIRKYLLYLMTIKNLSFWYVNMNSQNILTKASFIKKCWETQKIDLLSWLQITIKIMKITQSYTQFQDYIVEIGKIINCEQIVNSVKIQNHHIFHFQNNIVFQMKLNKLLNSYGKLNRLSQQGDFILRELIQQIRFSNMQIDAELNHKLKQLYRQYLKKNVANNKGDFDSVSYYYLTYARADIQSFFYRFSIQTRDALIFNTKQSEIDIDFKDNWQVNDCQREYRVFKYYLYQFTFNMTEQRYELSLEHLRSFINICHTLNIHNITLQGLKNSHQISILTRRQDLIIQFTYKLYSYCKSTHHISFYLLPTHQNNTLSAMSVFARFNHKLFYEFLHSLIDFVCSHPLDSYIRSLLDVLNIFLQKDSSNGYLIHYKNFVKCQSFLLHNPYTLIFYTYCLANETDAENLRLFKIIATNVDRLSDFAKFKIMQKYFSIYLRLIRREKLRQRFFIFRHAKLYLGCQKNINQIKNILSWMKGGRPSIIFKQFLKSKAKQFVSVFS